MESVCSLDQGATVVDVGCGTGGFLAQISTKYTAIGTDTSPLAIEYCRRRGLKHLHLGTLDDFPAERWSVDAVSMLDVIEHIEDDVAAVEQVFKLLRPGGFFIVSVPANPWMWSAHDVLHMHQRRYTKDNFRRLLKGAGFMQKKLSYFNTFLFPLAVVKRLMQKDLRPEDIRAVVEPVPAVLNSLFHAVFSAESVLLKRTSLPFGVSLVGIFQKPL
jgi:SAM-dependent methyltransferase